MPEATKHTLADLPADAPLTGLSRRRVIGELFMLSEVRLQAGFVLEPHAHHNEQMSIVLEGRCVFQLPQPDGSVRELDLGPGDVLHIPPHVPHGVRVLEPMRILDLFAPPSQKTGIDRA